MIHGKGKIISFHNPPPRPPDKSRRRDPVYHILITFAHAAEEEIKIIVQSIRDKNDDMVLMHAKKTLHLLDVHKENTKGLGLRSIDTQLSGLAGIGKISNPQANFLNSSLQALPDIVEGINRKKALILCQVFTQEDLQAVSESSDIEEALTVLSVSGERDRASVKTSAIHLTSLVETERLAYCVTPGYKRFLEGYKLDPNQEIQKYNGREINYWTDEIKRKIDLTHQRAFRLHQRAVVETRNNIADKKPKAKPDTNSSSAPTDSHSKKSPGTPRELTQAEIDALILHNFEETARHNVGSYNDFIRAIASRVKHGVSEQVVCERLNRAGLTENDFHLIRAYRELECHVNGGIDLISMERQLEEHSGYTLNGSSSLRNRLIFLRFQFPNLMGVKNSSGLVRDVEELNGKQPASLNSSTDIMEEFFTRPISRWESNIGSLLRAIGYEDRTFNTIHDVHVKFHDLDGRKRGGPLRTQYEEFDKDKISVTIYYSDGKEPEYIVIPDLDKSEYQILSRRLNESAV